MFFYMSNSSPFVRKFLQKIFISIDKKQQANQMKKQKKGVVSPQADHIFSVILHKSIQACKRISFCFFSKHRTKAASMTVEAALVLPLFMFAIMNLMSFIEIYRLQSNMNMKVHQTVKEMVMLGSAADMVGEDECIDFIYPYQASCYVSDLGFSNFLMYRRMRPRVWSGYDNESETSAEKQKEEMVYITENGEVYHTSKSCTYLIRSIRAVDLAYVDSLRNASGACYYACESCGASCTNTVFVTAYGNRYHATLQCSSLKRNIVEIPRSKVGGKSACKKCG